METSLIPAVCKLMTENGVLSDAESTSSTNPLSPPLSRLFSPQPLTEKLTESQELAKEIQRQDKANKLPLTKEYLKLEKKYSSFTRQSKGLLWTRYSYHVC